MTIDDERQTLTSDLAALTGLTPEDVDEAVSLMQRRHAKPNLVFILATVSWLSAMTRMLGPHSETWWSAGPSASDAPLARLRGGRLTEVATALAEHLAGPYDVRFDGNWPSAAKRLVGKMPAGARAGDSVVGGDGGGVRAQIEVLTHTSGALTGEVVGSTWVDPPGEDVWIDTYRRLEAEYPDQIPPRP